MEIKYPPQKVSFETLKVGDTFTCNGALYVKCHPDSNNTFNAFNLASNVLSLVINSDRISPCKVTIIVE